ncbi:hypothetical protein RU86_GL000984 [Lactococcus piscium]|uniref:Uncharacterized protein n=1 Tax=Pseudolactococcus piscium TaxID=1364 RepID=A0A2A5S574_9LACT|nr:hypothetical protein RU86_GL000984 [Lactococcus piscium]
MPRINDAKIASGTIPDLNKIEAKKLKYVKINQLNTAVSITLFSKMTAQDT